MLHFIYTFIIVFFRQYNHMIKYCGYYKYRGYNNSALSLVLPKDFLPIIFTTFQ
jgi:hypothetical protein